MSEWLEQLRSAWAERTPRERLLVAGAAGTLGFVVSYALVIEPMMSLASGSGTQAESAEQELAGMARLRREYDEVAGRVGAVEQKIQSQGQRRNLLTVLETLAAKAKVKVDSMEERQSANNERYAETKVEVSLKSVSLMQTITYLHQIEDSTQLLSVKSLRVRTRPDNAKLLDVTFAVSSFEPI